MNNEVSCYGNSTVGDLYDYWIVEVVDDILRPSVARLYYSGKHRDVGVGGDVPEEERIHSLTTRMRFKHKALGCYLRAANAILPQWGFKQIEVSCEKENNPADKHTWWNVESHWNERRMSFSFPSLLLVSNI